MTQRILERGQIETLTSRSIPRVRLPDRARVFADRAARLRTLAQGHALGGYLVLIASLCDAQRAALARHAPAQPDADAVTRARAARDARAAATGSRDASWQLLLHALLADVAARPGAPLGERRTRFAPRPSVAGLARSAGERRTRRAQRSARPRRGAVRDGRAPGLLDRTDGGLHGPTTSRHSMRPASARSAARCRSRASCAPAAIPGLPLPALRAVRTEWHLRAHPLHPLRRGRKDIGYHTLSRADGRRRQRAVKAESCDNAAAIGRSSTGKGHRRRTRWPTISRRSRSTCCSASRAITASATNPLLWQRAGDLTWRPLRGAATGRPTFRRSIACCRCAAFADALSRRHGRDASRHRRCARISTSCRDARRGAHAGGVAMLDTARIAARDRRSALAQRRAPRLRARLQPDRHRRCTPTSAARCCRTRPSRRSPQRDALRRSTWRYDLDRGARGDRDEHVEGLAARADRRRGRDGGQQQRRRRAARAQHARAREGGDRLARRAGRDRRRVPHSRHHGARRRASCVEVGTTNRTHLRDYEQAIGAAHRAADEGAREQLRDRGFTAACRETELAALAHEHGLPLVVDLGSGTLVDLARYGLPHEPTAARGDRRRRRSRHLQRRQAARRPAGRHHRRARGSRSSSIKKNPLKRALRVDKMTLAALEAVLALYAIPSGSPSACRRCAC